MTAPLSRAVLMRDYARTITDRLAEADAALRVAVGAGDPDGLIVGLAEREAALTLAEQLVDELGLAGLAAAEHAAIIRQVVQGLERSQVAQVALEAELLERRRPPVTRGATRPPVAVAQRARAGEGYLGLLPERSFQAAG